MHIALLKRATATVRAPVRHQLRFWRSTLLCHLIDASFAWEKDRKKKNSWGHVHTSHELWTGSVELNAADWVHVAVKWELVKQQWASESRSSCFYHWPIRLSGYVVMPVGILECRRRRFDISTYLKVMWSCIQPHVLLLFRSRHLVFFSWLGFFWWRVVDWPDQALHFEFRFGFFFVMRLNSYWREKNRAGMQTRWCVCSQRTVYSVFQRVDEGVGSTTNCHISGIGCRRPNVETRTEGATGACKLWQGNA